MLSTEPMEKVRMLFLRNMKNEIIGYLHEQGFIDIRKSKLELPDEAPDAELNMLNENLIRINGALQILGEGAYRKSEDSIEATRKISKERLIEKVSKLSYVEKIFSINGSIRELKEDIKDLEYAARVAGCFSGLNIDFSLLNSKVLEFRAYLVDQKSEVAIERSIKNARFRSEVILNKLPNNTAAIFVAVEKGFKIEEVIKSFKVEEFNLNAKYISGTPAQMLADAKEGIARDKKKVLELGSELDELRKYRKELLQYREMLEIEIEREGVVSNFKKTSETFVVEGWIEKKKFADIEKGIRKLTKGACQIEIIDREKSELAPTLVKRPKILKPFDYMMEFLSVPRSDEIDPTWIFIISFPIFYGLMVSDVGYGIASLLFVTWITTFTNPEGLVYNTAKIWQFTSVSAIFFGILSNEYFGFHLNQYIGLGGIGFDWLRSATTILLITIIFGIVQVSLGLLFGFINRYRKGEVKLAVSKLTSIVVILSGTIAVGGAFFGLVTSAVTLVSTIIAVAALLLTALLSGIEATEITNLITHPLSYARILGFGMGSVIIAMLIDQGFTPTLSYGVLGFIGLLIVFITLHFLNMIMAIFEGVVQGIRLNFVEFFSKFYIGGGIKFRPFSYKKVYTK
ncbi:MAG: V-type ATP synthase subunit I [Candidatus Micrarchaeia archaeon]